jgi:hypothetical protein
MKRRTIIFSVLFLITTVAIYANLHGRWREDFDLGLGYSWGYGWPKIVWQSNQFRFGGLVVNGYLWCVILVDAGFAVDFAVSRKVDWVILWCIGIATLIAIVVAYPDLMSRAYR